MTDERAGEIEASWQAALDRLARHVVTVHAMARQIGSMSPTEEAMLRELIAGLEHLTALIRDLDELPAETWAILAALDAQLDG